MSQGSDERAYTHSKRERSASPNPQATFRMSALNRPVTHRPSTRAGPEYSPAATWNPYFDESHLVSKVFMWCEVSDNHLKRLVRAIDRPIRKQEPSPKSDRQTQ